MQPWDPGAINCRCLRYMIMRRLKVPQGALRALGLGWS
jgi:hypothetical protein